MKQRHQWFGSFSLGIVAAAGMLVMDGCESGPVGDIAEQCGLDVACEAGGFLEGKASISGVASIDSFFGAAIDLDASMNALSARLRARLDAIGASVGLAPGATGADLQAGVEAYIGGFVSGGLSISYQPAQCQASVEAGIAAAAECDVDVDPGEVSAKCSGSCELQAGVTGGCSTEATLVCTGSAPGLDCTGGTCSGSCVTELSVATTCEGTCRGSCEFDGGPAVEGFEGRCDGMCEGECAVDMSAGAECSARCEGSCEYTPASGECEAGASARCEAMAGASIECDAGCEGTVDPPEVSAECEATVEAKASASIQCTPPTLAFSYRWAAGVEGDVAAQAEFRAWLEGFRAEFSAIVAARAEAEVIVDAAAKLVATAGATLLDAVTDLTGDANIKAKFGARCALQELPVAADALADSSQALQANVGAAATLVGAF